MGSPALSVEVICDRHIEPLAGTRIPSPSPAKARQEEIFISTTIGISVTEYVAGFEKNPCLSTGCTKLSEKIFHPADFASDNI